MTRPAVRLLGRPTAEQWHSLVDVDADALPSQTPEWIGAVTASGRWVDDSRLYEIDGRRVVLPLVRVRRTPRAAPVLASMPEAWGFGGPVGDPLDQRHLAALLEELRDEGAARTSIRPNPLHAAAWSDALPAGAVTVARRAHVLDLRGGVDAIDSGLAGMRRRGAKKAMREGVEIRVDATGDAVAEYYELFLRSVDRWAGRQKEPKWMARARAARRDPQAKLVAMHRQLHGSCRTLLAYHGGRAVAGLVLLLGRNAHYTRGAMDRALAGPVRANDLLQVRAITLAAEAGCASYHLGDSGTSSTLAAYKESFGAVAHDYAVVRFERAPFTRADRAARSLVKRAVGFRDA